MTLEHTMYWDFMGRYYGYPQCCIDWFNGPWQTDRKLTDKQESVHGYHGFIPCPSCAEKVTKETIYTLIKNRICDTPYPNDGL